MELDSGGNARGTRKPLCVPPYNNYLRKLSWSCEISSGFWWRIFLRGERERGWPDKNRSGSCVRPRNYSDSFELVPVLSLSLSSPPVPSPVVLFLPIPLPFSPTPRFVGRPSSLSIVSSPQSSLSPSLSPFSVVQKNAYPSFPLPLSLHPIPFSPSPFLALFFGCGCGLIRSREIKTNERTGRLSCPRCFLPSASRASSIASTDPANSQRTFLQRVSATAFHLRKDLI